VLENKLATSLLVLAVPNWSWGSTRTEAISGLRDAPVEQVPSLLPYSRSAVAIDG
jgi:hypothetical protein